MGWVIALAVLLILLLLPIRILLSYDYEGAHVLLGIGPAKLAIFPRTKSPGKKDKAEASNSTKKQNTSGGNKGGKLADFLPLLEVVLEFISELRKRIVVTDLEFKLILTNSDPCDLSINYGRAWAIVGNVLPFLERFFNLKKRDINISCDYLSNESVVYVRMVLSITFGRLLLITLLHGGRALKLYFKIINKSKGGAKT